MNVALGIKTDIIEGRTSRITIQTMDRRTIGTGICSKTQVYDLLIWIEGCRDRIVVVMAPGGAGRLSMARKWYANKAVGCREVLGRKAGTKTLMDGCGVFFGSCSSLRFKVVAETRDRNVPRLRLCRMPAVDKRTIIPTLNILTSPERYTSHTPHASHSVSSSPYTAATMDTDLESALDCLRE